MDAWNDLGDYDITKMVFKFQDSEIDPTQNMASQDVFLPLTIPMNPPTVGDWDAFRPLFTQLDLRENKKLEEVRTLLETDYSFQAT